MLILSDQLRLTRLNQVLRSMWIVRRIERQKLYLLNVARKHLVELHRWHLVIFTVDIVLLNPSRDLRS